MEMSDGPMLERNSEIDMTMDRLDSILADVGRQIDTLQSRLTPVMRERPATVGGQPDEPPMQAASAIVIRLRNFVGRAEIMSHQIEDTMGRLEV